MEDLALRQLEAWETIARDWPLGAMLKAQRLHLVCEHDHATVFVLSDAHKHGYRASLAQVQAGVVAHLRDRHRELDPDHG